MFTSESPPRDCDNASCSPGEVIDVNTVAPRSELVGKCVMRASSTRPSHEATGREEETEVNEGAARLSPMTGASAGGSGSPVLSTGEGDECTDGVGSLATVNAGRVVFTAAMASAVAGDTEGNWSTSVVAGLTARMACSREEVGSGVTKVPAC